MTISIMINPEYGGIWEPLPENCEKCGDDDLTLEVYHWSHNEIEVWLICPMCKHEKQLYNSDENEVKE